MKNDDRLGLGQPRRSGGQVLITPLVVGQLVIAAVALAVMIVVALQIGPLVQEKAALEQDVTALKTELEDYEARVAEFKQAIAAHEAQARVLESEKQSLETALAESRALLEQTSRMSRFAHPIDLVDLKLLASRHPQAADALQLILQLREQNVGWHLGGRAPEQGFDSPSFATFVLKALDVEVPGLAEGADLQSRTYRLYEALQPVAQPGIGDLAIYPAGYALFYFRDRRDKPFVIGMTPMGITALEPDFAEVLGYRRSGLSD